MTATSTSQLERMGLDPSRSRSGTGFIDEQALNYLLDGQRPGPERIRAIVAKSLNKEWLTVGETAELLLADDPASVETIFEAARELKRTVYGNRIVLFAPLYIGNLCINDCSYCAFKRSNPEAVRRTLSLEDLRAQVASLEDQGHKRLIAVFGEHPRYDAEMIARCIETIYQVHSGPGEIRRTNINAAPLDHAGFKRVHEAGIGTYQVFMETYHRETYARVHPPGTVKGDYEWRLDALSRAFEAGQDDVGIGALFGLYDWRFEVLGLVSHAVHLQQHYGCGPHTISFPRLRPAQGVELDSRWAVSDHDFKRVIAILRLAVPYTGLILTAREPAALRRELLAFGVSQIDAGSRIELGGYTEAGDAQVQHQEREQFELGDVRSLDAVMQELLEDGYLPSFCTACYRVGRTGEHFMEFAIPGFIKRYCTPNGLTTLQEYLNDYASPSCQAAGAQLIADELAAIPEGRMKQQIRERLAAIERGDARDCYF
ncbi:MAG: [FeFe] hydrogenase H-cluster radical SAM maturase HydG [Planctomycetota bacterium]